MPKTALLTKDKINQMKNEFILLDADGDGTISTEELRTVLRTMRVKFQLTEGAINKLIKEIDQDGNGTIDIKEYMTNMKDKTNKDVIHRALIQRSSVRKEFHKFDADGSGHITRDELMQVIKSRKGLELSEHQLSELLDEADADDDGKINYEEFVVMMTK